MNIADPSSVASGAAESVPDPDPLRSVPAADEAVAALAGCPVAVAGVDADGNLRWANDACRTLLPGLRVGVPLAGQCGFDANCAGRLAAALAVPGDASGSTEVLRTGGETLRARVQPLAGGGGLVWLTPTAPDRDAKADVEAKRLNELLGLACHIGRLGVWERDLVTGQGHWDERVFRTRGLDGTGAAPTFDDAIGGILESDLPAFEAAVRQSLLQAPVGDPQNPRWHVRYRIRGRDGVVRALNNQWFVERDPDGRPLRMVGLVTDDSDTLALMRNRDESVSQLALAADLTGIAVWRHDLATGLLTLGKQAFAVFDFDPSPVDIPIDTLRARLHPADRARAQSSAQAALAGGPPADDEMRLRRRDGQWRTLVGRRAVQRDSTGQPQAIVGVAMDVTERVDASRRAAELGRRFELATGAAGIGYWTFDARSRATCWSAPLCRMHGLPPDTPVPGLRCWLADFVHPADRALVRRRIAAWRRADRRAGVRLDIDLRIGRPGGEVRELLLQVVVEDEGVDGGNLFGLVLDVTERRLAETARRERERALQESEAKSRFLSRMNHELRTPLNAVLGFAQLLRDEDDAHDPAAAKRAQRIAHIRSAGLHLLELINDALDLSSLEGGETPLLRRPVQLATLVAETLPLVEALSRERGVSVDAAGAAEGTALADPMRLRQALLNLVSNAVKYNRRGGSVRIDAWVHGETAVLRVADTGRGMTAQQLCHLFEPFNRLGAESEGIEGSGIGLTIVKSLTERMGGSVHVESEAGVGSVFELRLPAAGPAPPRPQHTGERPRGASRSLLYIEDDPVNAMIMSELLVRRHDLVVHLAEDGAGGLDSARRLQPGLILLDMQLPDIDGLEVLVRLRADPATASIPVVGLSANAMRDDVDRARAAGIDGYWSKPIDHAAFLAALDPMFDLDPSAARAEASR